MSMKNSKPGSSFRFICKMKRRFLFLLLAGVAVSLPCCSSSIPLPDASYAEWASRKWSGTTVEDLIYGRRLYISQCSGCHGLRQPAKYSEAEWKKIMGEMRVRAGVKENEETQILKYLVTTVEFERQNAAR